MRHIGEEIKKVLKKKDMKEAQLARLIKITPAGMSKLLNNPSPSMYRLRQIGLALDTDFTIYLHDMKNQPKDNLKVSFKIEFEVSESSSKNLNIEELKTVINNYINK